MSKARELLDLIYEKNHYEGQVVIINPKIDGSEGGVGIVKSVKGNFVMIKNQKTKETHSFHSSDIEDVDKASSKWITKEAEKILDQM